MASGPGLRARAREGVHFAAPGVGPFRTYDTYTTYPPGATCVVSFVSTGTQHVWPQLVYTLQKG
jgi:hypothetical protein